MHEGENDDIVHFWIGGANGAVPRGVPANVVYGFAPMTAPQFSRFMRMGADEGAIGFEQPEE